MLELHRALRSRGADVCLAAHGGTYEAELRAAGVAVDLLGSGMDEERCAEFVRSVPGIGAPDQSMWSDAELRACVEQEVAYFRDRSVGVAVTGWTLPALLSTRVVGIPLVTEHAGSMLPPVFERGLLPAPSSPVGMPLERWLPAAIRRQMFNRAPTKLTIYTSGFNRIAAELGVEGVPSFAALLLGDLTLVTDVPEVLGVSRVDVESWTPREPSRYRTGTRLRYAGPIFARLDSPVPERVERFLQQPGPVVYVAITSSTSELVREVVANLCTLDVRLLVAATVHDLADLKSKRVLVEGVLPSHTIMPQVDLAVIAGGQGSVQTALASGLPFVGIPLQPEQDANVAFVERQGAARLVSQRAAGTAALTGAARDLLDNGRYRASAQQLQKAFGAVDGPGAAADAILTLLDSPTAGDP
jgi:UDP:flavonoid glycosyltransferase YjiC (YdhE family)